MYKRGILCVFMALAVIFSGFSETITVNGTAPTFRTDDPAAAPHINDFNDYLESAFDGMLGDIQKMIDEAIPPGFVNSDSLLTGFGTSSVFASHGSSMRAYADYKFMSISIGSILGLKLPENTINTLTSGGDLSGLMSENMTFGINPQFFSLHVGLNPSAVFEVFPKNLFLGLRLGFFGLPNLPISLDSNVSAKLNYSTFTIGLTANYQLVPSMDLAKVIKWRGVNIGSGLIFQTTKLDLTVPIEPIKSDIADAGEPLTNLSLVITPRALLNMNVNTFTIPIEVMTAIKLSFLNIPFGIGFDIGFGKTELSIGAKAGVNIEGDNSGLLKQDKAGRLSIGIENDSPPSAFNFKIMTGLGFTFGDKFMIDIPITFYITDGFNLGFTLGVFF